MAKHVPRLRAHRAINDGENKAAVPHAFIGAYPPERSSHVAYAPICSLAATVVLERMREKWSEREAGMQVCCSVDGCGEGC